VDVAIKQRGVRIVLQQGHGLEVGHPLASNGAAHSQGEDPEPQESIWGEFRKTEAQRQALSLAFFEELSHDQVASALRLPLGTVKTRIRSALLKLLAASAVSATHGWYKNRPGAPTVVLALHLFPQAPPGTTYQGWVRIGGRWVSLGTAVPDAEGNAVVVAEGQVFAVEPEAVEVTREPWAGSSHPGGPVMTSWGP